VAERITDLYVKYQKNCRPNLDISHRCILRCPQCIRQKTSSQDQIRRSFDLEEENFQKILNYYEIGITFCGQISDPIYHPNFLNFLKICHGKGKAIRIATNGSGKSREWWEEAYSYGKEENAWYFGVDGIDEKSELYRIGSNFKNVWEMMKLGRDLGHNIVWQYIIFGYNENEVNRAIEIAKEENFSLLLINTNRGFNPTSPLLRKNVNFQLTKPSTEFLQERVKKEYWGHKTKEMEKWQMISANNKGNQL
jgi:MoaA/NifB/PqqE/SkfB family radical SAM enzyme